jgi:hypothetical protein
MGIINSGILASFSSEYFMYGIFLYIKVNQTKTRMFTQVKLKDLQMKIKSTVKTTHAITEIKRLLCQ